MSALLPQLESRLGLLNRLIEAQRSTANNTDTSSSATHQIIVEINNVMNEMMGELHSLKTRIADMQSAGRSLEEMREIYTGKCQLLRDRRAMLDRWLRQAEQQQKQQQMELNTINIR